MVVKQFQDSGRPPFWKSIYHYISVIWCFCTEQRHCGACKGKWWLTDTDLCHCGETQMISHIVESCPLTKLNGGLSRLHSADEDAVLWLTSYGSWHAYAKKKKWKIIRFSWNFVHSSTFWTRRTSRDQKWKSCIGQTPSSTERISCLLTNRMKKSVTHPTKW